MKEEIQIWFALSALSFLVAMIAFTGNNLANRFNLHVEEAEVMYGNWITTNEVNDFLPRGEYMGHFHAIGENGERLLISIPQNRGDAKSN